MGSWGTKLFMNDGAADVQDTYREHIVMGMPDGEAEEAVIREFSMEQSYELWLPLAVTEWRVGRLSGRVKERAVKAAEEELAELTELWKPGQADRRREELRKSLELIASPQPARKKLRLPGTVSRNPWPVGGVIQYRLDRVYGLPCPNPFEGEYVLLQIVGERRGPADKLPQDTVTVALYDWHGKTPPAEDPEAFKTRALSLVPFRKSPEETLPYMSLTCERWFIREQDIRLVSQTGFCPWTPCVKPGFGDTDFDYVLYKTLLCLPDKEERTDAAEPQI